MPRSTIVMACAGRFRRWDRFSFMSAMSTTRSCISTLRPRTTARHCCRAPGSRHAAESAHGKSRCGASIRRGMRRARSAGAACGNPPAPATLSADGESAVFRALLALSYGATLEARSQPSRNAALPPPKPTPLRRACSCVSPMRWDWPISRSAQPARARASFMRALDVADQAALAATHENRALAYLGLARAALLDAPEHARRCATARGLSCSALHGRTSAKWSTHCRFSR